MKMLSEKYNANVYEARLKQVLIEVMVEFLTPEELHPSEEAVAIGKILGKSSN
jgi:hypothetical protein